MDNFSLPSNDVFRSTITNVTKPGENLDPPDILFIWFIIFGVIMTAGAWCMACCAGTWRKRKEELCGCNLIGLIFIVIGIVELVS
jgi:hypothetical protein